MCEHCIKLYFNRALPIDWNTHQSTNWTKAKWKSKPYYYSVQVPCGYCLECRLAKAKDWATRCICEARCWAKNCFVTLTYNTPNLPLTAKGQMTLRPKDVQDFFKRLLKKEKSTKFSPIRRFYCGEYGPKGGRPHYHAIIFNYCPDDLKFYKKGKNGDDIFTSKKLQKIWGKGFVTIGTVTTKSAGYVARYTLKKAGVKPKKRIKIPNRKYHPIYNPKVNKWIYIDELRNKDMPVKEFTRSSRRTGIGYAYFTENFDKLCLQEGIYIKEEKGIKINPLPNYFKKMWKEKDPENYYRFMYRQEIKFEELKKEELKKHPGFTWEELQKIRAESLKKRCKALKRDEDFKKFDNLKNNA